MSEDAFALSKQDRPANDKKPKVERSALESLSVETARAQRIRAALKDGPVALVDLGSSKVSCAILKRDPSRALGPEDDGARLLGVGVFRARGMRSGAIDDVAAAAKAVRGAMNQAEAQSGERPGKAIATISGGYPRSYVITGEAGISGPRVVDADLAKAAEACRAPVEMEGRAALHAIPAGWSIDGEVLRGDPRGLAGRRLGLDLHLLTCAESAVANLAHCLDRADLDLLAPVSSPLASGLAALTDEERDDGAAVLDLGAAVSSVGLFLRDRLVFADALRVGGEQATLDVARVLGIDIAEAERLKTLEGSVVDLGTDRVQLGEAAEYGAGRVPTRAELTAILRPRIEETLELARDRLAQAGFAYLPTPRLVLAGGGAEISGALDLARKIFGRAVRLARPAVVRGADPAFAGPAFAGLHGLARYAVRVQPPGWGRAIVKKSKPKPGIGGLFQWLRDTW